MNCLLWFIKMILFVRFQDSYKSAYTRLDEWGDNSGFENYARVHWISELN